MPGDKHPRSLAEDAGMAMAEALGRGSEPNMPRKPSRAWISLSFARQSTARTEWNTIKRENEPRDECSPQDVESGDESAAARSNSSFSFNSISNSSTDFAEKPRAEPPYHIFTRSKKKQLMYIVSLAGLFSPLSSNIYFPALGTISKDLQTNIALVSLTITVYMIVQGIAPSFWGPLSDTQGRRFTFIGTFVIFLISNVGLGLTRNFATLMVFRGLQAAGSAATVSIGAGVIGDYTTPKERGGYMGTFGGIRMMGQSLGPVLGGIITQVFGFRAIFWFLLILGLLTLLLIVVFLPETHRGIAGNGTVLLTGINKPLIYHLSPQPDVLSSTSRSSSSSPGTRITASSVLAPFRFLLEKDVFLTLFFGAVVYTVWSTVTSSTTALFQPRYGLSDLQTGLVFLPNGAGCVLGSWATGRLLDADYRAVETAYLRACHLSPTAESELGVARRGAAPPDFPVARARLRSAWWLVALFIISTAGYGFSASSPVLLALPTPQALAVPLLLQFVIAFAATAVFTQNSALVVDLYPGASASATAVNNLIRCSLGAAGVGLVQFAVDALGAGLCFLVFALVTAGMAPCLVGVWVWGEGWRADRLARLEREEQKGIELGAC